MKKYVCMALLAGLLSASFCRAELIFADGVGGVGQVEWVYPVPLCVLKDPDDVLRLINRDNPLDKAYPDQSLDMYTLVSVAVPATKKGDYRLRAIAADALAALFAGARAEGVKLYVGSAYRDFRAQEIQHYNRVKKLGRDDGVVQRAGASEHQSGLAADVVGWAYRDGFRTSFGDTKEGKWLADNCARYGFILRYPKGKEEITGISYEPWHLRYVGVLAAAYMTTSGLVLEEFTEEWRRELSEYERVK
ncbi:MAG: M15 family metallopeptidase [Firmicutes bacterium]|nr:M15 family metallopeptidase [Bacillota bacterium]